VERGHIVVVGQAVDAWRLRRRADERARIAAGLEQQHMEAGFGEARGHGPAART